MASIKKRSGTYYVIYDYYTTVDSKRVRKSKWEPFSNEEDAKIRKAEIDLDKAKNSFVNPSDMTVKEFFEKWLPIHARKRWSYKTLMQAVSKYFVGKPKKEIDQIIKVAIEQYFAGRQ